MPMNKFLFSPLLALLMLMSSATQADIGEQQAVSIAQSVYPGRVLAIKQVQASNSTVYRVKTLSAAGDVHIIVIDANSGKVISKQ